MKTPEPLKCYAKNGICQIIKTAAQKMKFSIKDFFSKCDQMRSFLRIWPYLLKKYLMEIFIFLQWL